MPSLLDRLLDDTPPATPITSPERTAAFRSVLARDLEALLNTRMTLDRSRLALYPRAADSILGFGLPDACGLGLHTPSDRIRLAERVRRTIERHEPRLTRVQVAVLAQPGPDQPVRLRIEAALRADTAHTPIRFDATLQLSSNDYRIAS